MTSSKSDLKDIPDFEALCILLDQWNRDDGDASLIFEMQELEGYEEWLDWMRVNRPEKLP